MWGGDSLGGILGDNLGEGNCESKIASRQWGDNFCRETSICLAGLGKGGFQKGGFGGCYLYQKRERGYIRMFPCNKNQDEGTFGGSSAVRLSKHSGKRQKSTIWFGRKGAGVRGPGSQIVAFFVLLCLPLLCGLFSLFPCLG